MMKIVEVAGNSTMEVIETDHPSPDIPDSMIKAVRARIGGPRFNSGNLPCDPVLVSNTPKPYLSIIAFSDHGQLALRFDQSSLGLSNSEFDAALAYDALEQALAFHAKIIDNVAFQPKPGSPDEDASTEDQRMWVRTRDFEAILVMCGIRMTVPGLDKFPSYVLKCALDKALSCLAEYHRLLEERVRGEKSATRGVLAYCVNFMNLGFVGTRKVTSDVVDGWAAGCVEGLIFIPVPGQNAAEGYPVLERYKENGMLDTHAGPVVELLEITPETEDFALDWFKAKAKGKLAKKKPILIVPAAPSLATLPRELLDEIATHLVPEDASDWEEESLEAVKALSRVCCYFQRVFQPWLFRQLLIRDDAQARRLYETLNGSSGYRFARAASEGVVSVADVLPYSSEKAYLRNAVQSLKVVHASYRTPKQRNSYEDDEDESDYESDYESDEEVPPGMTPDLRFLLQMMPNLRCLRLEDGGGDGHLLDKSAHVLRKCCTKLESFSYSSGGDLQQFGDRLAFGRVVGNMPCLKRLTLHNLDVGMHPWIFPEDLGPAATAAEMQEILGSLREHVWYAPEFVNPEPPPERWLPQRLREIHLADVFFAPNERLPTEELQVVLEEHCPVFNASGKGKGKAEVVNWEDWPSVFHPFSRLLLCSQNTLRVLSMNGVSGVARNIMLDAMRIIGPRLTHLTILRCEHTTASIITLCTALQSLTVDAYNQNDAEARMILDARPTSRLRALTLMHPWPFAVLRAWIAKPGAHLSGLKTLDIRSWGMGLQHGVEWKDVRAVRAACEARDVRILLPDAWVQWEKDEEENMDVDQVQ